MVTFIKSLIIRWRVRRYCHLYLKHGWKPVFIMPGFRQQLITTEKFYLAFIEHGFFECSTLPGRPIFTNIMLN